MSTRLDIRVIPRASKNEIGGMRDGRLVVRVTAPPVDSAANDAVIALLAKSLNIPRSSFRLTSGQTASRKTIAIAGLTIDMVLQRLAP